MTDNGITVSWDYVRKYEELQADNQRLRAILRDLHQDVVRMQQVVLAALEPKP